MSKSGSSSSSSSTTQNNSEDNRVVADGGGLALGKDAIYSVQNELSPNMLAALNSFVGLVRDAGTVVVDTADKANQSAQASIAAVTQAIQNDKTGTTTTEQTITKYIPLIIGAGIVIFIFMMIFRKKG